MNAPVFDLSTATMRALLISLLHVMRDAPPDELEVRERSLEAIGKLVVMLNVRALEGDGDAIAAMQEFNEWMDSVPVVTH